jgi:hypothetical protein
MNVSRIGFMATSLIFKSQGLGASIRLEVDIVQDRLGYWQVHPNPGLCKAETAVWLDRRQRE